MSGLGNKVAIVGVGETRYLRRSGEPLMAMMLEASRAALVDCGLEARAIDGLVLPGLDYAPLHELARNLGIRQQVFAAESLGGGAAVVSSILLAAMGIGRGVPATVRSCQGAH